MATLWNLGSTLGIFLLCLMGAEAGDFCYTDGVLGGVTYCTYGCCGSYTFNQYCCSAGVGLIVGSVFAAIGGLSIIIAVICCCVKKRGIQGRVIQTGGATSTVAVVQATSAQSSAAYPQPGYYGMGYPAVPPPQQPYQPYQPPPYGPVPPAYPYSDPAYPPAAAGAVGASKP